uniref:Cellulose biosynthesis protein BcsQ n=1 Tax=Candidatus Kentrum sp. FW TaxID=2126338 RepID=A0A450TP05_9GAMM|nr:MAG: Cellulose biosynthesis protein BcsQ [Candidatus Kentron sp. FW]
MSNNSKKTGQKSAKTICLFNHKGGVSKTTTAFNLGWCLADQGKKVLMVDLDSQCNLSGLVLGYGAIDDDHMSAFYESRKNLTMKPIVETLINGVSPESFLDSESGNLLRTENSNLFLLPGNLSVSELDSQISVSLKIATGVPATRNIPGNLPKILIKIASEKVDADYVIYDLSPNIGGLNEVILMASNYFIVPTSPDYFCLQAIYSLEKNIRRWHREIERFIEDNEFKKTSFSIANKPVFLGAIQQRYRPRSGKPAKSFEKWINNIRDAINDEFIPSLAKIDCVIDSEIMKEALRGTDLVPYDLAQIPDFNSLIAISQQLSKPVFALTDSEIKEVGKVFGDAETTMKNSRNNFREIFTDLAKRIIHLTSQ